MLVLVVFQKASCHKWIRIWCFWLGNSLSRRNHSIDKQSDLQNGWREPCRECCCLWEPCCPWLHSLLLQWRMPERPVSTPQSITNAWTQVRGGCHSPRPMNSSAHSWEWEWVSPLSFVYQKAYLHKSQISELTERVLPHHKSSLPHPRVVSESQGNSFLHCSFYGRKQGKEGFSNSERSISIKGRAELQGALSFPRTSACQKQLLHAFYQLLHVWRRELCFRAADSGELPAEAVYLCPQRLLHLLICSVC